MKFYHSFPRLGKQTPSENETGLATLASILEFGLLLTPEVLEIPPNPMSDRTTPPSTTITQYRACFTLLNREELLKENGHTILFGRFSIALDSLVARRLGIVPTHYYYQSDRLSAGDLEDAGISEEVLFRLCEIRQLLIVLAHIEAYASDDRERYKPIEYLREAGMLLNREADVEHAFSTVDRKEALRIKSLFDTDRVAGWNLAEWVEIMLSMFQTADSAINKRHLAYYAQREWRIIQFYASGIWCVPLNEKRLLSLPEDLWLLADVARDARRSIGSGKTSARKSWIDDSYLLHGYNSICFRDFIDEIVVPLETAGTVRRLLERHGLAFVEPETQRQSDRYQIFRISTPNIPEDWRL